MTKTNFELSGLQIIESERSGRSANWRVFTLKYSHFRKFFFRTKAFASKSQSNMTTKKVIREYDTNKAPKGN